MNKINMKCVLVGDSMVGKTHMWLRYRTNQVPTVNMRTIHDTHKIDLHAEGKDISLAVEDTGGYEKLDRLRPLVVYPNSNVVVICFDITQPESFKNVIDRWTPEIKYFCPGIPIILVGTKSALRKNPRILEKLRKRKSPPISVDQGISLARRIGAATYVECDAHEGVGLENLFEWVLTVGLRNITKAEKQEKQTGCLGSMRWSCLAAVDD